MRTKYQLLPTNGRSSKRFRGFSLMACLMMMVLLTLVTLGLLSLSTITLRNSAAGSAQATARANARLAMMIAIGQLQRHAGPDTRATAPAGQLEIEAKAGGQPKDQTVSQPHWVGIWPTTVQGTRGGSFLVGRHGGDSDRLNYLVDLRTSTTPNSGDKSFDPNRVEFARKGQLAWLVSSPGDEKPDPLIFAPGSADSRVLLGLKWQGGGDAGLQEKIVRAPSVTLRDAKGESGSYAYWVSDESQKANLAVDSPHPGASPELLAVSQTAPLDLADASFKGHGVLTRGENSELRKVATFGSASLLSIGGGGKTSQKLAQFVHDFTADSVGLLTNPQTGGFQQDLSAFLASNDRVDETTNVASAQGFRQDASIGTPGLSIGSQIVQGPRHSATAPRFGALKAWADFGQQVTGSGGNATVQATLPPWSGSHPYRGPDLTRVAAQPVHPVMAEFTVGFDFSPFTSPQAGRPADRDGLRLHMYPRVVLWNPYNVALTVPSYVAIVRFDPRVTLNIRGASVNAPYYQTNKLHYDYPYLLSFVTGDEKLTQNCLGFVTEPTVIPPGQSLVFTPKADVNRPKIAGTAIQYDPNKLESNVLTCSTPPGQENFYADAAITTKFTGIPQNANNNTYGFSSYVSDVAMYYELKGIPAGSGNNITPSVANSNFPSLYYVIPNAKGTSYEIYEGLKNAMNTEGQVFREYDGSTRHAQSTWRQGVRLRYFDESFEWGVRTSDPQVQSGAIPYNSAWSQYNLRGGHIHTSWLGPNVNYSDSSVGKAWEWNPGGNYLNLRGHRSNDDQAMQAMPNNSNQFTLPPFGTASDLNQVGSFVFYDLPRSDTKFASIAQFQHAQLAYQNFQSGQSVAWSFQDTRSERAATVVRPGKGGKATQNPQDDIGQPGRWSSGHSGLIQKGNGHTDDIFLYDLPFEVNHRLFDGYCLSTLPYSANGSSWDRKQALVNSRLRVLPGVTDKEASDALGSLEKAFNRSATILGNHGAFNVNSTSEAAWIAHLSGLRGLARESLSGGTGGNVPYSRFEKPWSMNSGQPGSWNDPAVWNATHGLSDDEIRELSKAIVREVKLRGPFLSLSDFVNRRLVEPPSGAASMVNEDPDSYSLEATGRSGTIDAAIRRAKLNSNLEAIGSGAVGGRLANGEQVVTDLDLSKGYLPYGSQPEFRTIGLPGYLTQGDLLTALAPTLTARGDTFVVRAYGETREPGGKVTARAWCEAVVQRSAFYLDPSDEPAKRPLVPMSGDSADPQLDDNSRMSVINKTFGRRFDVVSFRWLSPEEV